MRADDLEADGAAEGVELLGLLDEARAAMAEDAEDAVGADPGGMSGGGARGGWRR